MFFFFYVSVEKNLCDVFVFVLMKWICEHNSKNKIIDTASDAVDTHFNWQFAARIKSSLKWLTFTLMCFLIKKSFKKLTVFK